MQSGAVQVTALMHRRRSQVLGSILRKDTGTMAKFKSTVIATLSVITAWGIIGGIVYVLFFADFSSASADYYNHLAHFSGECLDKATFVERSKSARDDIDWTSVKGSATWSNGKKLAVGMQEIIREMKRMNIKACPDIQLVVDDYWRTHKS